MCQRGKVRVSNLCSEPPAKRRHKYGAQSVMDGDDRFDSKRELARYKQLLQMQRAGIISEITRQVVFELAPACIIGGRKKPPLKYIADFCYSENGAEIVEDVKGFKTKEYRIKRHLMQTVHGIAIKET